MSSGVSRVKTGAFTGTAAELSIETVGFKPKYVRIVNVGGLVDGEWAEGMTEGRGVKRVTGGTMSQMAADAGITPTAKGFTLGADADLNGDGEACHWVAFE